MHTQHHAQNICCITEHSELRLLGNIQQIVGLGKEWQHATKFKVNSIFAGQFYFMALRWIILFPTTIPTTSLPCHSPTQCIAAPPRSICP